MSLSCEIDSDYGDCEWYYNSRYEIIKYTEKRGRRCRSCDELVRNGDDGLPFYRWRAPRTEIEERIYGDGGEIEIATWWYCDRCANQAIALNDLGFVWELGSDNMQNLVEEYKVTYQGASEPCQ